MTTPRIVYVNHNETTSFTWFAPDDKVYPVSNFAVNIPASTKTINNFYYTQERRGWVAVRHENIWAVVDASIPADKSYITISLLGEKPHEALAFPIDPRMTRADIEGATRIYPNADNTGWLFAHAEIVHHHERIIQLEAIMHTLFEDLVHSNLESVLKVVVGANNPSPEIGTELLYTYNAQFGSLSNYSNLVAFRQECVKWCTELEKLLHVGQHVQEDDLYLQHQLVRAIKQAKAIWKADTGKARNLATIETHIDAIIAKIETEHKIETRWEKAARIEAEKKKREAAEASDTETESPSD